MEYDVLVLGDYYCDLIFAGLPHMPALGEEVFGARFEIVPGGAFIPAVALRRLGARVGWAADFGDDLFSAFVAAGSRLPPWAARRPLRGWRRRGNGWSETGLCNLPAILV